MTHAHASIEAMSRRRFSVSVPATSANMGPGFDCMGVALQVFNTMTLEVGHPFSVEIQGESASMLPADRTNVVVRMIDHVLDISGSSLAPRDWRLEMVNRIPVGSGLGSSASAIVGGLLLGNALLQQFDPELALSNGDILKQAIDIEGHPDNVSPALLGGACLSCPDDKATHTFAVPVPDNLHFVVAVPYFALYTEESRKVVPLDIPRSDAIFNVAQAARLTLAMATGDLSVLRGGFGDKLHEPFRQNLIPGFADVKRNALRAGALAVTLSGAGPSLLAWCDEENVAWQVADQMTLTWREHNIPCQAAAYRAQRDPTVVQVTSSV